MCVINSLLLLSPQSFLTIFLHLIKIHSLYHPNPKGFLLCSHLKKPFSSLKNMNSNHLHNTFPSCKVPALTQGHEASPRDFAFHTNPNLPSKRKQTLCPRHQGLQRDFTAFVPRGPSFVHRLFVTLTEQSHCCPFPLE